MKEFTVRIVTALIVLVAGVLISGCGHFADRDDDRQDPDHYDGVYAPNFVLEKMDEQRKDGKWRQQY